jgi:DNA repair exonuclease SbcCD ATPase subunit
MTTVSLNINDPTLIIGRNYDSVIDGQVDSNGSGKSTILNSLLMCLFDTNLMNIDKNSQINNTNNKDMLITCTLKVGSVYYKIERYRKNKSMGGDGVRILRNENEAVFGNEHDITPDSVANSNKKIEEIIGIPYDMFIRIVVFSATHEPFLSLPSSHTSKANQRDIIEELFGLTELTTKADLLKEKISNNKSDLKNLIELNTRIENEKARIEEQVLINKERYNKWNEDNIENINKNLKILNELKSIDPDESISLFDDIEIAEKEINSLEKKIPVLESELKSIKQTKINHDKWILQHDNDVKTLEEKIASLALYDFDALLKIKEEKESLKSSKISILNNISLIKKDIDSSNKLLEELKSKKEKINKEINILNENECPYCHQHLKDSIDKIHLCNEDISKIDHSINEYENKLTSLIKNKENEDEKLVNILNEIDEINKTDIPSNIDKLKIEFEMGKELLSKIINEENPFIITEDNNLLEKEIINTLTGYNDSIQTYYNKINMAKEFINSIFKSKIDALSHQSKIDALEKRNIELSEALNPYNEVIISLESQKIDDLKYDDINEIDNELKHEEFLLKLLTKKDSFIRKALLNKSIPILNSRLRYNLDKIGLPHKVVFNDEMAVDISQFGSKLSYGNFSSGQKARVNLCLAFAFRDVLQSRFGKINLCILDECLDTGLGNVGVVQAAKMIKSIAVSDNLSLFVISHKDEVFNMFDKKLEIELRNGFSTIVSD